MKVVQKTSRVKKKRVILEQKYYVGYYLGDKLQKLVPYEVFQEQIMNRLEAVEQVEINFEDVKKVDNEKSSNSDELRSQKAEGRKK